MFLTDNPIFDAMLVLVAVPALFSLTLGGAGAAAEKRQRQMPLGGELPAAVRNARCRSLESDMEAVVREGFVSAKLD